MSASLLGVRANLEFVLSREKLYVEDLTRQWTSLLQEQWCKNDGDVYLQEGVSGHGVCVVEVRMRIRQLLYGGPESDETRDQIQDAKRVHDETRD